MTLREKTFVFRRESPTMQPLGFQQTATSRLAVHGGFLTWAAKPKVRESPEPREICPTILPLDLDRSLPINCDGSNVR